MVLIIRALLVLFVIFVSACSSSKPPEAMHQKITPAHPTIDNFRIEAHEITYKKMGNSMKYRMSNVVENGRDVYKLEIYFNPEPDSLPDTIYLDSESLAFVGRHLVLKDYTIKVTFDDGVFSGDLTPSEGSDYKPVKYNKTYPHGAFEPAVINYAISVLPLELGYKASIPVFDLNNGSEMFWSNIEVVDRETLSLNGNTFDTWKVESQGIRNKTIWVSVDKPYAVKMETEGNMGAWLLETDN